MKMLVATPLRSTFRLFGNSPFKGWGLTMGSSTLLSASDGTVNLWDGNGAWQTFPTNFSGNANNKYYSCVLNMTSGGNAEFFIDGVSMGTLSVLPFSHQPNGATLAWGSNYSYTDNIQYHDRVLTSSEIAVHAAVPRAWQEGLALPDGLGDEEAWYCPSLSDSAYDLSGNGVDGAYNGGLATVNDTNLGGSKAYEFNGSSTYIRIYDNGVGGGGGAMDFLASADWSASFYAKCDNASGNARDPFFGTRTRSGYTGWYASNNDSFSDYTITTGEDNVATFYKWTNNPQLDTDWHHVCFVNNGGTVSLYVDNVLSGVTNSIPDLTEMTSFFIGRAANYFYFDGRMDDIRLYSRAIATDEIAHLATSRGIQGGPTPPPTGGFYNPFSNKTFNPNYTRRIG
jgi:hypothetical protein